MPSSAPIRWSQLPPSIASTLQAAVRRIRKILWTRGLLATGATALVAILVIMGIDAAFTLYSNAVRWAITLTGAAVTAVVAWHSLVKPLSKPFTPARIAAILEARHPELEERISTVVEILSSPDAAYADTLSGELFTLLSQEAEVDASKVSPKDEFTNRTVKPKFYALAGALAVLAVLFCLAPKLVGRLFLRAVNPAAEVDNVYADSVSVEPGDAVVLLGDPLTIHLDVKGGFPGLAYVRRKALQPDGSEGPEIAERMRRTTVAAATSAASEPEEADSTGDSSETPADPAAETQTPSPSADGSSVRRYEQTIPVVTTSFKYRVNCGHALTRYYTVTAVEAPAVEAMTITLDYPAYTGREPAVFKDADVDIAALPGTQVSWSATFNREDLSAHLVVPGVKVRKESRTADSSLWTATVDESTNSTWTLSLSDSNGYTNTPVEHVFRAIPDTPPTITLDQPRQLKLRLPPHSKIPLQLTAHDDFGVSTPEIWYAATDASAREIAGGEYRSSAEFSLLRPVRVFQHMDDGAWRGVDAIDLSTLDLSRRKYFQFELRVSDNLPAELGGPHVATSSLYSVELDQSALSLSSQSINAQEKRIRQVLEEVVQRLTDSRNTSSNVLEHVRSGGILDDIALEQLSETRRDTAMARTLSARMAEELADSMFRPFADRLSDFAAHEAKTAADRAEEVPLANPQDRLGAIETSENASETARARAAELLDDLTDLADRLRELERLRELAEREKALAEAAQTVKDADEAEMWKKLQEELEAQLKEELAKDPETLLEMLEKREEKLKDLAEEAKKLADEQSELKKDAEDLASPDKRDAAAERLEEKTQDMPEDATPEERLAKLEEDVAAKAEDLRRETKDMRDDLQEFGEPVEPLLEPTKNAAQNLDAAADKAEDAADDLAPKQDDSAAADQFAEPDQNGQQDQAQDGQQDQAQDGQQDQPQDGQQDQPQDGQQAPSEETRQKMQDAKELLGDAAKNLADTASKLDQMKDQLQQAIDENRAAQDEDWPAPDYDALNDAMQNMENAAEQVQQFQDAMEANQQMQKAMDAQQKAMDALEQAADANRPQEQRDQAAQEAADWQQQAMDAQQQAMEKMQDAGLDPAPQQEAMDAQQQAMDAREKAEETGAAEDWKEAVDAQKQAMDAQKQAGENFQQQTGMEPQPQDPQQQGESMPQDQQQGPPMPQDQQQAMQQAMQKAQQQAQQAAQQMQQQMQQMMQQMNLPAMPDPNELQDPKNAQEVLQAMTRQMQAREHAQEIPEALRGKITEADWFRIQGDARSGASGNLNNVPAEYRELVRDYFQALSADEDPQP